ncbi:MAG: transglycosylase SLT domain-containing protein, partial [Woeseiaceae bacterium]
MALAMLLWSTAHGAEIDNQRDLFRQVHAAVERGNWGAVEKLDAGDQEKLRRYVLWPDLRAAFLRATINTADPADITAFLDRHGTLKPARELRYRYALHLAEQDDLAAYLTIYQAYYQGLDITRLDCLAITAEIETVSIPRIVNRARELWLVGNSQVGECDTVFAFLHDNNLLGPAEYRKRFALAIKAREFTLARWLAKSIDQKHVDEAAQWQKAQLNSKSFVRTRHNSSSDAATLRQMVYAFERITYADPVLALELWNEFSGGYGFSEEQKLRTARHIALWTARDNLPGAYILLASLPMAAQSKDVLRWRARLSLRDSHWSILLTDIALMPEEERHSEQWRYWRAVAMHRSGQLPAAEIALETLSGERSYYGFLAADELGKAYAFDHSDLEVDAALIEKMTVRPDLIRARELFLVGLDGRGRSEWDAVVAYFSPDEKIQAAILANRWGWHSRAISTVANIGYYDDLTLRYPLPYRQIFDEYASAANISATWAYGIARSESLFMRDVRSSAGAVGLMQLMPATGRSVARTIQLHYSGLNTLTDPDANIRLGTTYLGRMADRYGGHRVLATA